VDVRCYVRPPAAGKSWCAVHWGRDAGLNDEAAITGLLDECLVP
jgi:hypothetical protein